MNAKRGIARRNWRCNFVEQRSDETERQLKERARSISFSNTCRCGVGASGGKVGVCVRCCVQHRAHNLLTWSVSTSLLANRFMIQIIEIPPDHSTKCWHGLGRAIVGDLAIISLCSICSLADCRVLRALSGAIEANGISQETDSEADDKDPL